MKKSKAIKILSATLSWFLLVDVCYLLIQIIFLQNFSADTNNLKRKLKSIKALSTCYPLKRGKWLHYSIGGRSISIQLEELLLSRRMG